MSDEPGWKLDRIGRWSEPARFDVTREHIAAYARATNDTHPAHVSGDLAPPVFAVCGSVMDAVSPQIMAVAPERRKAGVVHGGHELRYHRPIVPGMTLVTRAAVTGVRGVSSGVMVVGTAITTSEREEPVVEQRSVGFFRGGQLTGEFGEPIAPGPVDDRLGTAGPATTVIERFDDDQASRYAQASGDHNPIHLDDAAARSVGLPGIIIHGLCTLAFCSRAVVAEFCPDDPSRIERLAARFAAFVRPGETVSHTLWRSDCDGGRDQIAFETTTKAGAVAVRDGIAVIRAR